MIDHLPNFGSDHAHILLDTKTMNFHKSNIFRFEAKWLLKDNLGDLIKSVWSTYIEGSSSFHLVRKTNSQKRNYKMAYTR